MMNERGERKSSRLSLSILICFNIIFAVCGGAILSLGVIILRDVGRQLLFRLVSPESSIIIQIGSSLLGIGAFGFLTAVLGCSTAARKCSIGWYIFCVSLVLLAEISLGVSFLFFHDSLGKSLEGSQMITKLQHSYGLDQPFTQAVDFAQHKFKCCGAEGDADYERSTWRNSKLGGVEIIVPWTCCPLDEASSDFPAYMNPVPINSTACQAQISGPVKSHRFKEGCNSPVDNWFKKETLTFLGMGLTILLLQVSSLTAAICLCRKVK